MSNVRFATGILLVAVAAQALAQHAEHGTAAEAAPRITDEMRAAAFPELGAMNMADMMIVDPVVTLVLLDRFERHDAPGNPTTWDIDVSVGRDLAKVLIRSEGERRAGSAEHADLELLWSKSFARWWDFVAGARHDFDPGASQDFAAVGIRGLTPYRFDIEATGYWGENGATALRFESQYQILVTNRLILEPQLELNWHGRTDRARRIGAGLSTAELGLRLRYEFRREIAPYVGLVRSRRFGTSAALTPDDSDHTRLVAGIRLWF